MTNKMTYAAAIDLAIAALGEGEAAEKLAALKVQLAKRGSGSKGLTKVQKENAVLKEQIVELLADGGMTATEVADHFEIKVQKASALLSQLYDKGNGPVKRVKEGRTLRFELA